MASVYILYSKERDRFYTGSCKDLEVRLSQHKEKLFPNSYTAFSDDWNLFLSINDLSYKEARAIEKHIKKMKSAVFITNLNKYPELVTKLVEKYRSRSR